MNQTPPAIDPSIAYLAETIERSVILQCAHMRMLLRHQLGYHVDPGDPRYLRQAIEETLVGRSIILGKE